MDSTLQPGDLPGALTADEGRTVKDVVCGMQVVPAATVHHAVHENVEYHFCSASCRTRFIADSAKYLVPSSASAEPLAAARVGTSFTCPMHPEIRQVGPGSCPICGMALEPEMPTLEDEDNPELRDFSRRFLAG